MDYSPTHEGPGQEKAHHESQEKPQLEEGQKPEEVTEARKYLAAYHDAMLGQSYTGKDARNIRDFCVEAYDPQVNAEAIKSGIYGGITLSENADEKIKEWAEMIPKPEEEWVSTPILRTKEIEAARKRIEQERRLEMQEQSGGKKVEGGLLMGLRRLLRKMLG